MAPASCPGLLSGLRYLLQVVCPRWHCPHPASMKRAGGHLPKGVGLNRDSQDSAKSPLGQILMCDLHLYLSWKVVDVTV